MIVIRRGIHGERQRFNLAHELGHMVMEVEGDEKFHEKAAHRFAGAFLMPAEALWSNVGRHRSSIGWGELFALKQLFGASVQAIMYRCGDLGIFPPSLTQRLFREFSRSGLSGARRTTSRIISARKSRSVSTVCATGRWPKPRSRNRKRRNC